MRIERTNISGIVILQPKRFGDERGYFSESWNYRTLSEADLCYEFVQDNHSVSSAVGTVRGLHFQRPPHAQAKLVRCGRGRIFDVAVDVRKGSPTFGDWVGVELSRDNGLQIMIPEGFLHGFMTLEPDSEILYKCTDYYAPECDGVVHWDSCGIEWPKVPGQPVLSEKDASAPPFSDFDTPFEYRM